MIISPRKIMSNIRTDVSRASHTHQVPQVGLPQIDPVNNVANVKQAPIGAQDLETKSARVCLKTNEQILHITITE